jgi:hypothetical protein
MDRLNSKSKVTPKSILNNIKSGILAKLIDELEVVMKEGEKEIYFPDIVSEVLDRNCPTETKICTEVINEFDVPETYIDDGLIDTSSTKRMFITSAYARLELKLFQDEFFQDYLQSSLNNETINLHKAKKINQAIINYIVANQLGKENLIDSELQVFVEIGQELKVEDFPEPFFNKSQVIDLFNGIKILANNHDTNKNAIVMEKISKTKQGFIYRVYIMDKSKGLDMRQLLVKYGFPNTIGSHNGYNLDPREYVDQPSKNYPDKKYFIYTINKLVNGENGLIVLGDKEHEKQ